jgi:hypothetical protein
VADENRRVEPRSIIGTGMTTDPDRIRELEAEQERVERQRREKPKKGFGEVLAEAPEAAEELEEEAAEETLAADAGEEGEAKAVPAPLDEEPKPRVPPDPRMAQLNAMLDGKKRGKGPGRGGR